MLTGQGRIKHDKLEGADPAPDFLAAAALAPERAEPLIWLCWHYHKRLDACAAADRVCRLQNRVAAFYYARAAAAVPYPLRCGAARMVRTASPFPAPYW